MAKDVKVRYNISVSTSVDATLNDLMEKYALDRSSVISMLVMQYAEGQKAMSQLEKIVPAFMMLAEEKKGKAK